MHLIKLKNFAIAVHFTSLLFVGYLCLKATSVQDVDVDFLMFKVTISANLVNVVYYPIIMAIGSCYIAVISTPASQPDNTVIDHFPDVKL